MTGQRSRTRAAACLVAVALAVGAATAVPVGAARAAGVAAQPDRATIPEADCRLLLRHVARSDVTYVPGVDVHGRPVVPADLSPGPLLTAEDIVIDISVLIFAFLGRAAPRGLDDSAAHVATITFRDGRLYYNDQPLGDEANPAVAVACEEELTRRQR